MKNLLLQLLFNFIFLPSHTTYIIKVLLHLYMYIGCSMLFFVGAYVRADIHNAKCRYLKKLICKGLRGKCLSVSVPLPA
jgi:hypothetical protein